MIDKGLFRKGGDGMGDLKEKYESFKEQVRQAADIVSVVSETVDLKKKGRRFWGCCPFHSEKRLLLP